MKKVSYFFSIFFMVLSITVTAESYSDEELPSIFSYIPTCMIVKREDNGQYVPYLLAWRENSPGPQCYCYKYKDKTQEWIKLPDYVDSGYLCALAINNDGKIFLATFNIATTKQRVPIGFRCSIYNPEGTRSGIQIEEKETLKAVKEISSIRLLAGKVCLYLRVGKYSYKIPINDLQSYSKINDEFPMLIDKGILYSISFVSDGIVLKKSIEDGQWKAVGNLLEGDYKRNPSIAINEKGELYIVLELEKSYSQNSNIHGSLRVIKLTKSNNDPNSEWKWEQVGKDFNPLEGVAGADLDDQDIDFVNLAIVFTRDGLPIVGVLTHTGSGDKIIVKEYVKEDRWECIRTFDDKQKAGLKNYSMIQSQDGSIFVKYEKVERAYIHKLQDLRTRSLISRTINTITSTLKTMSIF